MVLSGFLIRFQVRYGTAGLHTIHPYNTHRVELTVFRNKGKLKKRKRYLDNKKIIRKPSEKDKEKNNSFKPKIFCSDMEWNGYLYTGFKWENGWPTEAGSNTITGPASPGSSSPVVLAGAAPPAPAVLSTSPPSPEMDTTSLVSTVQPPAAMGQQQPDPNIQVKIQEPHSKEEKGDAESDCTGTSYITSQVSDESEDEADERNTMLHGQVALGSGNVQCRAAREAGSLGRVVDISCNENMLSTKEKKTDRIGTLENSLDPDIKNCFKGARIERNGNVVNQFMSCLFDPSTLLCITCSREHKVLEGEGGQTVSSYTIKTSLVPYREPSKKNVFTSLG